MNIQLMDELYGLLILHPEVHDQSLWCSHGGQAGEVLESLENDCGTTACLAGWAAFLAAPKTARVVASSVRLPDGHRIDIPSYAQMQLGWPDGVAYWMFRFADREQVLWGLKWLKDHPDTDSSRVLTEAWQAEHGE